MSSFILHIVRRKIKRRNFDFLSKLIEVMLNIFACRPVFLNYLESNGNIVNIQAMERVTVWLQLQAMFKNFTKYSKCSTFFCKSQGFVLTMSTVFFSQYFFLENAIWQNVPTNQVYLYIFPNMNVNVTLK